MNATERNALQAALDHLDKGDWDSAHKIVQNDESQTGCWIHGIVHVMEGDHNNARYWYERAKRTFSDDVAPLWPLEIPPPVAGSKSLRGRRQGCLDCYSESLAIARRLAACFKR